MVKGLKLIIAFIICIVLFGKVAFADLSFGSGTGITFTVGNTTTNPENPNEDFNDTVIPDDNYDDPGDSYNDPNDQDINQEVVSPSQSESSGGSSESESVSSSSSDDNRIDITSSSSENGSISDSKIDISSNKTINDLTGNVVGSEKILDWPTIIVSFSFILVFIAIIVLFYIYKKKNGF